VWRSYADCGGRPEGLASCVHIVRPDPPSARVVADCRPPLSEKWVSSSPIRQRTLANIDLVVRAPPPWGSDLCPIVVSRHFRSAAWRAMAPPHLLFEPIELLERLAALTPRPCINLVCTMACWHRTAGGAPRRCAYGRDVLDSVGPDAAVRCGTAAPPVPASALPSAGGPEASGAAYGDPVVMIGRRPRRASVVFTGGESRPGDHRERGAAPAARGAQVVVARPDAAHVRRGRVPRLASPRSIRASGARMSRRSTSSGRRTSSLPGRSATYASAPGHASGEASSTCVPLPRPIHE
jgi:hypothetical protein